MLESLPILSIILFSPLLGVLVLLFVPQHKGHLIKWIGIASTLVSLALVTWLYTMFDLSATSAQYNESVNWINIPLNMEWLQQTFQGITSYKLQLDYSLAIDGITLPLVFLTAFVAAMAALASIHIKKRWKTYFILFLLLQMGMFGVFLSRDLFLFFIFFESTLVPMFFLIGIYGFHEREKTANQFLIYNGIGSAFMLLAFLILIATAGMTLQDNQQGGTELIYSSNYNDIYTNIHDAESLTNVTPELNPGLANPFYLSEGLRTALFLLLLVAFGIKLPIFPFHTWMLRVHMQASPSIVMIHSGILLKMGAYGLLQYGIFLFPSEAREWALILAVLGVINILYGAALAFVQKDFKLVLAYSSISHMGIVLIALAALNGTGIQGALFQMISHGLISALLFLIVGSLIERSGTTELQTLGGLAKSMPFMSGILLVGGMASLGLPGLSGFISEFLAFVALFETMPIITAIACIGIILAAVYVLRAILKITFGPAQEATLAYKDARFIEALPMIALVAMILIIGLYPGVLSTIIQSTLGGYEQLLQNTVQVKTGG
jgi:NADH-quinone oxidoreductase subunit M